MRNAIVLIGWLACSSPVLAQSLDIAGVEVRVGQNAAMAIENLRLKLPDGFRVASIHIIRGSTTDMDSTSTWAVMKIEKPGQMPQADAATISMKDGRVSSIIKYYDLGDGSDIATAYSQAMRDVRRDAFEPCVMSAVKVSAGVTSLIRTKCGRYELDFNLSWTNKDGPGKSQTSIAVFTPTR